MKCLNCKKNFNQKRGLSNLFKKENYLVCDECYNRYKLSIGLSVIPLDNSNLIIYYLFENKYILNYKAFSYEYSRLFFQVYLNNKKSFIFSYETFKITPLRLEIFNSLSHESKKDIFVICNCFTN